MPVGKTIRIMGAIAVVAAGFAAAPAARAEMQEYRIDPAHFSVGFLVTHIGYAKILGMFREASGRFRFDPETRELGDVEVRVVADSVFSNDERRDGHLRGKDFLDAEAHPEILFTAKGGTPTGETTGTVSGDITIRGVTRPVVLDVTLNRIADYPFGNPPPEVLGISARTVLKRSDFGMDYAVANGWVGDEVELILEFEAVPQK